MAVVRDVGITTSSDRRKLAEKPVSLNLHNSLSLIHTLLIVAMRSALPAIGRKEAC